MQEAASTIKEKKIEKYRKDKWGGPIKITFRMEWY